MDGGGLGSEGVSGGERREVRGWRAGGECGETRGCHCRDLEIERESEERKEEEEDEEEDRIRLVEE